MKRPKNGLQDVLTGQLTASRAELAERYGLALSRLLQPYEQTRGNLSRLGRKAATLAGRSRAWSGSYLYVLLHLDRYDGYEVNEHLVEALESMAGISSPQHRTGHVVAAIAVNGAVVSDGVRILVSQIECPVCHLVYIPKTHGQVYCSKMCKRVGDKIAKRNRRLNGGQHGD